MSKRHGASKSDLQRHMGPKPYLLSDHEYVGFNQRMTDIQGALGLSQMQRANEIILERRKLLNLHRKIKRFGLILTPKVSKDFLHDSKAFLVYLIQKKSFWLYKKDIELVEGYQIIEIN